ncbi:MAG: glycoside hydrolase family 25 protein [Janthinobacterium lividum]
MTLLIPDVSHFEPDIQFHDMANAGIPAFITKSTQGTDYTDPTYLDFMARGRSVGLIAGAYAFINPSNGAAQAEYFLHVAHLQAGDLQPIVDAEKLGLTKATTEAALTDLEQRGHKPILYASFAFWRDVLGSPSRWPLWLAAYRAVMPVLPAGVTLFAWQYTDSATVAGVARTCDASHFYGTADDLSAYLI